LDIGKTLENYKKLSWVEKKRKKKEKKIMAKLGFELGSPDL